MRWRLILFTICLEVLLKTAVMAQGDETKAGRLSPKELTIPPSPVFDLMGVTPSQINRATDIKDFKVDWSFKSWRLNPNLAIQAQPVWEIFYNRKELAKYQKASSFMRKLASTDVSIGTIQNEDNDRRIGFAVKMNLFRQKDPLLAKELYEDIAAKYGDEKKVLEIQLQELRLKLDTTKGILQKPAIKEQISLVSDQLFSLDSRRHDEINSRAKIFVGENWNASSIDLAIGRVYTYQTDSSGSLTKLRLNRNTAKGIWINGALGIGKKILASALIRTIWYQEELNFLLHNIITDELRAQKAVADNNLYSIGLNLRYGNAIYNFFAEILYERKSLKTPLEALNDAFKVPNNNMEIVGSSVVWNVVHPNTLSIGGDWRIGRNVILNYGMRCVFDKNWKFKTFTPVAAISCMMR
jgi:hypothetical protein